MNKKIAAAVSSAALVLGASSAIAGMTDRYAIQLFDRHHKLR
jgi:dGTP triphosphohydrolase